MSKVNKWGALFDVDGVLIDSPDIHALSWIEAFRPYGIDLPVQRLHREEGRKSIDIARRIVADYDLNLDDDVLEELIKWKREQYRLNAPSGMRKDASIAIRRMKASGWAIGLVSGSVLKNIRSALSAEELDLFDVLVTAECYSRSKPHPEPYLTACSEINIDPGRCIAIENAPLGIASARAAGMKVVALTSTLPENELSEADHIIDDLTRLPELCKSIMISPTLKGLNCE